VKPTVKPDIALKEKREKERKQQELEKAEKARKQKELEAQREKERQKAEQKKREAEKAAQLKAQQQKEAAAKAAADKAAKEQQEAAQRQAAMAASAQAKTIDEYKRRIHDKIQRLVNIPPNVDPKAEVEFDVVVIPGGEVLSAKLKRSSNAPPAYVDAVERAILRAQPLPLPPDPALFNNFRELNLVFRPKD
jgi:colicin import membrane protein